MKLNLVQKFHWTTEHSWNDCVILLIIKGASCICERDIIKINARGIVEDAKEDITSRFVPETRTCPATTHRI